MMKTTLLIDLDGTLLGAHPRKLHWYFISAFIKELKQLGFGFIQALLILHKLKISVRDSSHQMNGVANWEKSIAFFSQLTALQPEEARAHLTDMSMKCFVHARSSLYKLKEAQEFILWAKDHYKLVLATNPMWPAAVVDYRLEIAGIHPSEFEFITHAENMSSCKPNVHYYQELKNKLNLKPEECFMIGNDEEKDGPAREIGVDVFILKSPSDFRVLRKKLESLNG